MVRFVIILMLLVNAVPLVAAPDRAPSGKSGGAEELPPIELNALLKDGGAKFGDWFIWRNDEAGASYFLVNQKTGLGLYFLWQSNGWVNYRTGTGVWYVLFPTGIPDVQDRKELKLERFLGKQPTHRITPGKFTLQNWTVTVTNDVIEFDTQNVPSRIHVRAQSPEFTHNGRAVGK